MEFLLVSQKRNRTWVMLKQLLLLLLRMAAIAAAVMMVTQPIVQNKLGGLFGGSKLHHIVLLDDSFSMSDHWADTSAFDEAKRSFSDWANKRREQPARQEFTLLRYSQGQPAATRHAGRFGERTVDAGEFPKKTRSNACSGCTFRNWPSVRRKRCKAAVQMIGDRSDVEQRRVIWSPIFARRIGPRRRSCKSCCKS